MGRLDQRSLNEAAWRFAGSLYLGTALVVALWIIGRGSRFEPLSLVFIGGCVVGWFIPGALPWERYPDRMHWLNIAGAAAVQAAFMPLWYRYPPLMLLPVFGAIFTAATARRRWIVIQMTPALIVLAVVAEADAGLRVAIADTVIYGLLWASMGWISAWLRAHIDTALVGMLSSQAEEADALKRRADLAGSLHQEIEGIALTSAEVEGQSTSIAGAVEELATSLRAGSEMAIRAQEALGRMSAATTDSQESITRLEEAGLEIVGIVDTITELSSQTNLLALNATIEAARAGEAGRGFAVVAKDVKDLAQLTSTSATNITTVVDQIQQRLDASGTATETISGLVAGLEADQLALTEMVSQQTETVEEISGTASSGAEGVSEIASAIRRLDAHAADLAGSSAVHR